MTRQRRVILEAIRRTASHPSADEVYEMVRQQLPHISLGTVYRTLAVLSEVGLVRELQLGGQAKRFDGDLQGHHHVRCSKCGRISDIAFESVGPLHEAVRPLTDYEIIGYRLEFVGVCPECRFGRAESRTKNDASGRAGAAATTGSAPTPAGGPPTPPMDN